MAGARVLLVCTLSVLAGAAGAEESSPLNLSMYQGIYSTTTFGEILLRGRTNYEGGYITAATVGAPLDYSYKSLTFESEGQLVRHSGIDKHIELNGVVLARTSRPRSVPITFAFGEGLSFASRNPDLENQRKSVLSPNTESEYSKNLLNYLAVEVEMGIPVDSYNPRAFVRVHHRSGVFGLLCPPTCGSNYMGYGMRFSY